jgi:hypothetical protein
MIEINHGITQILRQNRLRLDQIAAAC